MKMPYYILHGLGGYPEENWFPWLKQKLEAKGEIVIVPKLPNTDKPQLSEWLETFKKEIDKHGEGIIIGHSLGGVLAMHYLWQGGFPYKIILVATPYAELKEIPEIDNFFNPLPHLDYSKSTHKESLSRVKFVVFHSDDDPYVPLHHGESWSKMLKIDPIILHNKGHINLSEFPEILEYLSL